MTPKEIIRYIDCMRLNIPFKDNKGRLIYVSDEFNKLLDSCELFDRGLFKYPNGFLTNQYDHYLECILYFLKSIGLDLFRSRVSQLDGNTRELLLRNFDRLNLRYSDIDFSEYVRALIV